MIARVEHLTFRPRESAMPALDDVSLAIAPGEVVLVEGPSGSGKSTLLRALAGLVPHFHGGTFGGSVTVAGLDTRTTGVAELARHVGCVFQDPETQAVRATVAADVAFGLENAAVPADRIPDRVARAMRAAGAEHLGPRAIATLSGGERQRAAIAAVLARGPRLLLLDEPTSQLDDDAVAGLAGLIRHLADAGTAVVVAEHHAHRLPLRPDRTIRLEAGRLAEPAAPDPPSVAAPPSPGEVLLALDGVSAGYGGCTVLRHVRAAFAAGTVTALTGRNGSGKSTLLRVVAGLHPADGGRVRLLGRDVTDAPTEERVGRLGLLTQDAGRRLLRERVRDEVRLAPGADAAAVDAVLDAFGLAGMADAHPMDLSVGERERVALAAVLAPAPPVMLLDEPTRGMDPARRDALVDVLRDRAAAGAAVVVASHDPAFTDAVADEVVELRDGVLTAAGRTAARV